MFEVEAKSNLSKRKSALSMIAGNKQMQVILPLLINFSGRNCCVNEISCSNVLAMKIDREKSSDLDFNSHLVIVTADRTQRSTTFVSEFIVR